MQIIGCTRPSIKEMQIYWISFPEKSSSSASSTYIFFGSPSMSAKQHNVIPSFSVLSPVVAARPCTIAIRLSVCLSARPLLYWLTSHCSLPRFVMRDPIKTSSRATYRRQVLSSIASISAHSSIHRHRLVVACPYPPLQFIVMMIATTAIGETWEGETIILRATTFQILLHRP